MRPGFGVTNPYLASLLDETVAFVRRHVVFGATHADTVALWNAHTYVYDCAVATPYLHPHSPEPGSGKTTLLDVLEVTARSPIQADNLTEAVLFRMIDKQHPTLLFDEVDAVFGKKNSDSTEGIRQVLNSGYRAGKKAYRCVPPSHTVTAFDVYCPKATAGLNQLPPTLAHRSIPIAMKPPRPDDDYDDFDYEEAVGDAENLCISLQSWSDEAQSVLRDPRLKPGKLPGLDARGNEIWRILFRIADQAGGDWPERARHAAIKLSGTASRHGDASTAVQLLGHIRDLFDGDRMACSAIVDLLNVDDLPYGGWNEAKGITTRQLGKKLVPYGIVAKPVRIDGERAGNGYDRDQFEDAWTRYLPVNEPSNRYTGTTRMVEPKTGETKPVQDDAVPVSENGANPHEHSDVPVVPVSDTASSLNGGRPDFLEPIEWLARDGEWRPIKTDPPAFPGEVVNTRNAGEQPDERSTR